MQNAGQFGPGAASVHPPSTQFAQSEPSPTGGSTTSSLRQFRKKDAEKNNLDQQPTKPMSESHVARVAPHNHYPPPASNDVYRYPGHQFAGYSPGQVKFSDLAAETSPPNPISTSVIQKPKSKEYMEMCNVQPQQHLNNHPQYSPDNGQYMHKDPAQSYPSGFKPTESHFFPKDQHQYQQMTHHAVPSKYNTPMMVQNMRKYNSAPADNPFLDKLSKIHPSMARSIMSDHHLQNAQGYSSMDQRGMYAQQNHRYYPGALHQGNPYSLNPNYPMNSPHSYSNYPSSSCSYPRSAQMGPVGTRYAPMERSLSPTRRPYPETMHSPHMNYHHTMHQKIPAGPNYSPQYARAPEYAQHYQHRRMPQDYYAQGCRPGQYMQGHHQMTGQEMQEMQENTVSPSDSLKKFIENWADEEPSPEINPMDPNLRDKLRDDAPGTVYMINPNDLQYFENNGIPIVTSDNGGFHMTSENYQNLLKNGLVDNTAIVRIIESNKDNSSDNQDRVVNLQILETPKSDCMLANKQVRLNDGTACNPEDPNRRVVIHQNTIITSGNDKPNPDQHMPLVDNNNSITKELVDKNCSPINLDHLEHNLGFSEPPETENAKDSNVSPDDISSSIDKSPDSHKSMPIIDFFAEAAAVVSQEDNKDDISEEEEAGNVKSTEKNVAPNFNTVIVAPEVRVDSSAITEEANKFEPDRDSPSETDRRKRIFSVDDIMHNIGNNSRRNSDACSHQTIMEFIEREIAYSSLEQSQCHFENMKKPAATSGTNILQIEESTVLQTDIESKDHSKEFLQRETALSSSEQNSSHFLSMKMKSKSKEKLGDLTRCNILPVGAPTTDKKPDEVRNELKDFIKREIAFSSLEQSICHSHLLRTQAKNMEKPEDLIRSNIEQMEASTTMETHKKPENELGDKLKDFIEREIAFSSLEQIQCHSNLMQTRVKNMGKPAVSTSSNILRVEATTTLLELAGELMEITVNIVNGRKVINVTPLSDSVAAVDVNDNYEVSLANEESNQSVEFSNNFNEPSVDPDTSEKTDNAAVNYCDKVELEVVGELCQQMDIAESLAVVEISNKSSGQSSITEDEVCMDSDFESSISQEASSENVEDTESMEASIDKSSIKDNEASVEDLSTKTLLVEELNEKPKQSEIVQDAEYTIEIYSCSSDSSIDTIKSTTSDDEYSIADEQSKEEIDTKEKHEEFNDSGAVNFTDDAIADDRNIGKSEEYEESKPEDLSMKKNPIETGEENSCLNNKPILHNESTELKVEEIVPDAENVEEPAKSEVEEIQKSAENEISEILTSDDSTREDELKTDSPREENIIESAEIDDYNKEPHKDDNSLAREIYENEIKNTYKVEVIASETKEIETEPKSAENKDECIGSILKEVAELNDNEANLDSSLDPTEPESVAEISEFKDDNLLAIENLLEENVEGPLEASVFSEEFIELEVATVIQNSDEVFDFSINDRDHETIETTLVDFHLEDEVFIADDPPAHEVVVTDPLEGIGIVDERDIESPQIPLEPVTTTDEIVVEESTTEPVIDVALENKEEIVKVAKSEIRILSPTSTNIEDFTTVSKNILQIRKYSTDNDIFNNISEFAVVTKAAKKSYESDLQVQHDIVSSSNKDKKRISKRSELKKSKRLNEKVQAKNEQKEKFKLLKEKRKRKEELRQKSLKLEINLVDREIKKKRKGSSETAEIVKSFEKYLPTEDSRQEIKKRRKSKEEQKSVSKVETTKMQSGPKLVIELKQVKEIKKLNKEKTRDPLKHDEEEYVDFKELLKARKLKKLKKLQEAKAKVDVKELATESKANSSDKFGQVNKLEKSNACCIGCNSSSNRKEDKQKNKLNKKLTENEEPIKVNDEKNPSKVEACPTLDVPRKLSITIPEKIEPEKRVSFSEDAASKPTTEEPRIQKMHPKDPRRRSKTFINQVLAPSVSELIEENNGGASKKKISLADYVSRKRKASCTEIQPESRPKLFSLDSNGYERSESIESNNNTFEGSENSIKEKSLSDIKTSFLIHSSDWEDSHSPPPPPEPQECLIDNFSGLIKNNSSKRPVIDVNELTLLENPKDKKLQEYKDKVDSQLSSLNIQIPKSKPLNRSPKSNSLVSRFLNNEKLSQSEMEEIKKIVSYKKAMQHPKNLISPSKSPSVESFTNIESPRACSSSNEGQNCSALETTLHSKKVNSKRKTVSDADDEDSGSVSEGPKKTYSVFNRLGEDGLPKIIFKRNKRCEQTKEPIVQLVKLDLDNMETVKKKYNVTVRQIM